MSLRVSLLPALFLLCSISLPPAALSTVVEVSSALVGRGGGGGPFPMCRKGPVSALAPLPLPFPLPVSLPSFSFPPFLPGFLFYFSHQSKKS